MTPLYKLLLAIALFFLSHTAPAQGAWNLKYVPIDSVNASLVWKDVRIDFKGRAREKFHGTGDVRQALSRHDTVVLKIHGKAVRFFEDWRVYVDQGVLSEQTLRRVTKDKAEELVIREVFIRAVEKSSITVELYLYRADDRTKSATQIVTLKKSLVWGVLMVE